MHLLLKNDSLQIPKTALVENDPNSLNNFILRNYNGLETKFKKYQKCQENFQNIATEIDRIQRQKGQN